MHKIATINTRIEPSIKLQAEEIFHKVGLTSAEAVRMFYMQVCLHEGLPFEVKIPNKETIRAMKDANSRKAHKTKNIDDLFNDLD